MANILNMRVLMAGNGDCLWIEYGDAANPRRLLIDGGINSTFKRLKPMLDAVRVEGEASHQVLVVTHVDSDHIAGVLPILASPEYAAQFGEIWFNGRAHLQREPVLDIMGVPQGETLSASIVRHELPWNKAFGHKTIVVRKDQPLPVIELESGARITLLSPSWDKLDSMGLVWEDEVGGAGLVEGVPAAPPEAFDGLELMGGELPDVEALLQWAYKEDTKAPNGSSIAMLFEFEGATMLLGADAHPDIFVESIRRMTNGKKLHVDVFKLPHHGSRANVTPELLELVTANMYVFSSNGATHHHPDVDAVARVIHSAPEGATMIFNCRTVYNEMWDSKSLKKKWGYKTVYGIEDDGVDITLM